MTDLEPAIVLNKLDFMDNYLKTLEPFEFITLEEYLGNYNQQLVVERLLQLIIQVAIDINRHLLKVLKIEQPQQNYDTFIEVSRLGIIPPELAQILAESAELRNRLVHVYEEIDHVKVHVAIAKGLQYYPIYQRQIANYLDSLETKNG